MTKKLTEKEIYEVRDTNIAAHVWNYQHGRITKDELDRYITRENKVAEKLLKYYKG